MTLRHGPWLHTPCVTRVRFSPKSTLSVAPGTRSTLNDVTQRPAVGLLGCQTTISMLKLLPLTDDGALSYTRLADSPMFRSKPGR